MAIRLVIFHLMGFAGWMKMLWWWWWSDAHKLTFPVSRAIRPINCGAHGGHINPGPIWTAQNTKCTILSDWIRRARETRISDKWSKPHSLFAEFWRLFLNTCSQEKFSFLFGYQSPIQLAESNWIAEIVVYFWSPRAKFSNLVASGVGYRCAAVVVAAVANRQNGFFFFFKIIIPPKSK